MLGLSFKPNTSDVRDSPAIAVCRELLSRGARLRAYDPIAVEDARREMRESDQVYFAANVLDAATDATALIILTEWNEFRAIDLAAVRGTMRGNVIIDARNVLDPDAAAGAGFAYWGVGRRPRLAIAATGG